MSHSYNKVKALLMYPEPTPCEAPASWSDDGIRHEFIAVELSPSEVQIVDPTAETDARAVGKRARIKGARATQWSITYKWHGLGATTEIGNQAPETYLADLLKWTFGNIHRSNETTITGGTSAIPVLDSVTNVIPGCMIAFEDTTSPSEDDAGRLHFRRVLSVNAITKAVTLSEILPFTVANGDAAHATVTAYTDATALKDAAAAAGRTRQFLYFNPDEDTDLMWRMEGTVGTPSFANLGRGEVPSFSIACMSANFAHAGELSSVSPLPDAEGTSAQLSNLDMLCSIGVFGNTAINLLDVNQCSIEPGIVRTDVPTTTSSIKRFQGLASYSANYPDTKFTTTLVPYDPAFYAALAAGTVYRVQYSQPGPGSGAGKSYCWHFPKMMLAATPKRSDVNDVNAVDLEFFAVMPANDCSGGSNKQLENSPILIALA